MTMKKLHDFMGTVTNQGKEPTIQDIQDIADRLNSGEAMGWPDGKGSPEYDMHPPMLIGKNREPNDTT